MVSLLKKAHNIANQVCIRIIKNSPAGGRIIKAVAQWLKFQARIDPLDK